MLTFDTAQSSDTPRWDADIGQVKDTENKRRYIGNILTLTRLLDWQRNGRLADWQTSRLAEKWQTGRGQVKDTENSKRCIGNSQ